MSRARRNPDNEALAFARTWGPEGELALERQEVVRDAFLQTSLRARIEADPDLIDSMYSPTGRMRVEAIIATQRQMYGVRADELFEGGADNVWVAFDPYYRDDIHTAFEEAVAFLNRNWALPHHRWGWDSYSTFENFVYLAPGRPVGNPNEDTKKAAISKYEEFHRLTPTKVGSFGAAFSIPTRVQKMGNAKNVLYESGKKDPETLRKPRSPISYIHDHDAGVMAYSADPKWVRSPNSVDTDVPDFIKHAQALVLLGQCLGWSYDDGGPHEVQGTEPLPDLYCTVDGRALLVIQSHRTVIAMIWGGALGVEARGIVG